MKVLPDKISCNKMLVVSQGKAVAVITLGLTEKELSVGNI